MFWGVSLSFFFHRLYGAYSVFSAFYADWRYEMFVKWAVDVVLVNRVSGFSGAVWRVSDAMGVRSSL